MKKILLTLILALSLFSTYAQISITNNTAFIENFNGLTTSHLPGWSALRYAGTGTAGATLDPIVTDGNVTSGAIYNVGTASATDRALGSLASGSTIPRFGASYINNTGSLVRSVLLSGIMEQWKSGSNNTVLETSLFEYSLNATSINDAAATWVALPGMNLVEKLTATTIAAPVDGNFTDNKTAINTNINADITNGGVLWIRWSDPDNTGSDGLYAIDDLSVTFAATLPISLTSFTGKAVDKNILLSWNTASEINNNYFEVKHSSDGKTFTAIGKVNGAGNSTTSKDYSFADENPAAGTNYYQLVQYDFDGKTSSSSIIGVDSKIDAAQLSVYASSSDVKISISSPNQSKGFIQLFDLSGRKLAEQAITVNKGYNNISLPVSIPAGVHFARYTSEGVAINQKFVR